MQVLVSPSCELRLRVCIYPYPYGYHTSGLLLDVECMDHGYYIWGLVPASDCLIEGV